MAVNPSRRTLITAGLGLLTVAVAGCTKTVQFRQALSRTSPTETSGPPGSTRSQAATSRSGPTTSSPVSTTSTSASAAEIEPTTSRATTTTRRGHHAATPAVQIAHGPRNQPLVALTFHGAGDVTYAREILSIARAKNARLTVMGVGTWLSQNPDIGREILVAGHELGNHTLSHLDINSLSPGAMRKEVVGCRDILVRTTGSPGRYFRQSQSPTANTVLREVVGKAGYGVCLSYDLDSMDWTDPGAQAVRDNLRAARPGSIVSMHLGHIGTVQALPGILDDLQARGLRPVTVTTLLAT